MSFEDFLDSLRDVARRAAEWSTTPMTGKPEENTKDKLLNPLIEALGYGPDERTLEGAIRSLSGTTAWVDYYLKAEAGSRPKLMVEAKPFEESDLWGRHQKQVLDYMADYATMVNTDQPVQWLVLTNYREWHFVRMKEREPFFSVTFKDLADEAVARQLYNLLAREELHHERLLELFHEKQRDALTERTAQFLSDLKVWRAILANGIRNANPHLSLEEIRKASHVLLLRLLLVRLVETYGNEAFFWLGRTFDFWRNSSSALSFAPQLKLFFQDSWAKYNTELFAQSWVDNLDVPGEYFELVIKPNAVPDAKVRAQIGGRLLGYRSIYNYDFSTLEHDILGTAYEQFLAHELEETDSGIRIADNSETRKREGIYYTPSHIVRKIVREVVGPQVDHHKDNAIRLLNDKKYDEAYEEIEKVFDIRVVDPACGSGSFLLAAHAFIAEALREYNYRAREMLMAGRTRASAVTMFAAPSPPSEPRLVSRAEERALVECIYGVDLDSQAVGLAKLALWTQLLRLQPAVYGRPGVPHSQLPALGVNIRQGNSLIHAPAELDSHSPKLEKIADLVSTVKDLAQPAEARRDALAAFEEEVASLRSELEDGLARHFADPASKHVFTWEVEFPDVFDPRIDPSRRGFTAAIGNPPYYNVDSTFGVGAEETAWLRHAFPEVHTDKTDVLFYFFVRGLRVLREAGALGFIVSRSFLQGDKSRLLRRFLAKESRLDRIIDFQGSRVFEAGIATAIAVITNTAPPGSHETHVQYVMDYEAIRSNLMQDLEPMDGYIEVMVPQADLQDGEWILSPYRSSIFPPIDAHRPLIEHVVDIGQGMQTGENDVFVVSKDQLDTMSLGPSSPFVKPRASNTNISPFGIVPIDEYVLWTEDTDFASLPAGLRTHLQANRKDLESRAAFRRGDCEWYRFSWPLHKDKHFGPKIIHSYRAPSNAFAVDEDGYWLGLTNTTNVFVDDDSPDPFALSALLNSDVATFRMTALGGISKLTGPRMYEFFENQLRRLPIPGMTEVQEEELAELGRAAHDNFARIRDVHESFVRQSHTLSHDVGSLTTFSDPAGPYASIVSITSPNPNAIGYLISIALQQNTRGFEIVGRVTTEDDWEQGTQVEMPLARVESVNPEIAEFLLYAAYYFAHINPATRRKKKLSGSEAENLFSAALKAIQLPLYDGTDHIRNARVISTVVKRVQNETRGLKLHSLLDERKSIQERINQAAFELYGVAEFAATIRAALKQRV